MMEETRVPGAETPEARTLRATAQASSKRVVLVTNIPTPYRIPLFNELARQLAARGLHLTVLFGALGYRRRQWEVDTAECLFDFEVLPSRTFEVGGDAEKTAFSYAGLTPRLRALCPDVVVVTGFTPATMRIWAHSLRRALPYVIWTGSVDGVWAGRGRAPRSVLRTIQRRALVRRAAALVAYGSKARTYLLGLGAPPEAVHVGINTVDTRFFAEETERLRRSAERGAESDGEQHLIAIGYLSPRKGYEKLLRAVQRVAERRSDFVLDVVGDGEERPRLERLARSAGLAEHVRFHGYRQKGELPAFLARSRCLLYPTDYDIWGLVLVEAMAAGLPVIASVRAGATCDLVQEGATGFSVDFDDADAVADRICWILDHPGEARAMGHAARDFIGRSVTLEKSAEGFVGAIEGALARRHRRAARGEGGREAGQWSSSFGLNGTGAR